MVGRFQERALVNILLIYPEFPATFWSYKHALRFVGKRAVAPPLGLLTVAALLPKEFAVRLVDLNVTPLRPADLQWATYAFISAMTVQEPSARQVIARCRAAGVHTVAGGPLFTSQPETFPEVDHLVLNEAELTLPPFLADLAAGHPQRIYRSGEFADVTQSPTPRFELADLQRYVQAPIQYSRGCPFNCEFCDVTALFGHRPRIKTVPQILAELQLLRDLHWKGTVFFVDDNLIGNKRHLKNELLPALIDYQRRGRPTLFNSQASINIADDPELLRLLGKAGFDTVFIGVETPDPQSLAECQKSQNVNRDLLADIRTIHAAGIQVQGGFILGFDHDSPLSFGRLVEFIQAAGIVTAMVGLLQAVAGTRLYDRMKKESRLQADFTGDNVAATNIISLMDPAVLASGYAHVLRSLYSPRGYYQRLRTFLRHYKAPVVKMPFRREDVPALMRSFLYLGFIGRERLQYWRLLIWTTFHRPSLFPTAVQLAILGQHYRRVCEILFRAVPSM